MEVLMDHTASLAHLQEKFNEEFNFLKLEFYGLRSKLKWDGKNATVIDSLYKRPGLGHKEWKIIINGGQTVAEVEAYLQEMLGVKASIFRKSGNLWIETRHSSTWSLQKQNQVGSELSAD